MPGNPKSPGFGKRRGAGAAGSSRADPWRRRMRLPPCRSWPGAALRLRRHSKGRCGGLIAPGTRVGGGQMRSQAVVGTKTEEIIRCPPPARSHTAGYRDAGQRSPPRRPRERGVQLGPPSARGAACSLRGSSAQGTVDRQSRACSMAGRQRSVSEPVGDTDRQAFLRDSMLISVIAVIPVVIRRHTHFAEISVAILDARGHMC